MTEFVAASFRFTAENEDELSLEIGERIEVLEKDQFHSDGWWTVSITIFISHVYNDAARLWGWAVGAEGSIR